MNVQELKRLIHKEFGRKLEHATPSNVREFLDRIQAGEFTSRTGGRLILNEHASTFEEIIKEFFVRVLDLPRDEAIVMLWLLAFDLSFSAIELHQAETFRSLFGDYEQ